MKISSNNSLPALLELLRPPGPPSAPRGLDSQVLGSAESVSVKGAVEGLPQGLAQTESRAQDLQAIEATAQAKRTEVDPAEALLTLDVWANYEPGSRLFSASSQPPDEADGHKSTDFIDQLTDYILTL